MKKLLLISSFLCISALSLFAQKKDIFAGYYEGKIENASGYPLSGAPEVYMQVVRTHSGYDIAMLSYLFSRSEKHLEIKNLQASGNEIKLVDAGFMKLNGKITADAIDAVGKMGDKDIKIVMKRKNILSPTMGKSAPKGAIVLFDGKNFDKWCDAEGNQTLWEIIDGAMLATSSKKNGKRVGDIFTKDGYGAVKMHIEFKIPAEYEKKGFRGNSGVYFGPYEIQVLDSFGAEGNWMECGSIYRIHPPKVNASLEPEAWQTFDIEFYPAKYEGEKLVEYPKMTVYQNGIRIHLNDEVYWGTRLTPKKGENFKHPVENLKISLQYHDHAVEFRNIWIQEL